MLLYFDKSRRGRRQIQEDRGVSVFVFVCRTS